jgi:hypothetical protein
MNISITARSRFAIVLPISLALATFAFAQESPGNWHTVADVTGRFSFELPAEPQHQTQKDESHSEGPIVTDIYLLKTDPNLYLAGLTQYPQAAPLPDQEELSLDRDNFDKQVKATVVSEERKTFAGFPALEFKSKSEQMHFHCLIVKADHHVYQVVAAYKDANEPAESQRFINSLKLIKP